ncbi:hypothetical protein [Nocardia crassostreae]|uniref:hypothetical protein n=1 Tax=Nocardia crassostreae TaxID=53428 RepID=UPI000ACC1A0E|nr:hypothetical protein [Nocardia crassostreae]
MVERDGQRGKWNVSRGIFWPAVILAVAALTGCQSSSNESADKTADPESAMSAANAVSNACELLDPSVLNTWESTPGKREHREENMLGRRLTCDVENESTTTGRLAAMHLSAIVHSNAGEALSGYDSGIRFAEADSDKSASGPISGVGERAYFVWTKRDFNSSAMLNTASEYQLLVRDGAIEIQLVLFVAAPDIDQEQAARVTKPQALRILETLKG